MTLLSFVFYGWSDARFVGLLAGSILVNWAFGAVIRLSLAGDGTKTPRSINLVRAAVVVNLAFLGTFKYFHFFVDGVVSTADKIGLGLTTPALQIALPIGIS